EELFQQSCIGCHATSAVGESGAVGPNLASFGDRNRIAGFMDHDQESLVEWLSDTQEHKPGNLMPSFGEQLSDEELNAIAEYLMSLSVEK
ncbi:MAG: cytochrome c, partial [Sporosarcina sp.]